MDQPADPSSAIVPAQAVSPRALKRVFAISLLPMLGMVLFALGGALGLRAFAHNSSLECGGGFPSASSAPAGSCSHYSYWVPGVIGAAGLVLVMCGGAYVSYYAARHLGLPLVAALQQRRRLSS